MSTISFRAVVQGYDEDQRKGGAAVDLVVAAVAGRGVDWNAKRKEQQAST